MKKGQSLDSQSEISFYAYNNSFNLTRKAVRSIIRFLPNKPGQLVDQLLP